MNGGLLDHLHQLAREKDIPFERLVEQLQKAVAAGYKKHVGTAQEVTVELDETSEYGFRVYAEKVAVTEVADPDHEISLEEAREFDPETELNDLMEIDVTPEDFGRIAAQTVKQVMVQGVRDVERQMVKDEYSDRVGEVMPVTVQRVERGDVIVSLGRAEARLPRAEQMRGDEYRFGDRMEVLLLRVDDTPRGPQIIVSRSHPNLLRRLFEREVPEIHDGVVEIVSLAREPGVRSKVSVATRDASVDPVGACVGQRGSRVMAVTNELGTEKVDVIRFHDDARQHIAEALQPARISRVMLSDDGSAATVVVPDDQQSLAIGRAGQNVRLAARLTGLKLDIRSETQMSEGEPHAAAPEGAPAPDESRPPAADAGSPAAEDGTPPADGGTPPATTEA